MKLIGLLVLIAISVSFGTGCGKSRINRGFYYWKSSFRLGQADYGRLSKLDVGYLYIKFFDVTWENGPKPVSVIQFAVKPPADLQIIPTVFITNETLTKLTDGSVADLAHKISSKIRRICERNGLTVSEIQVDCDWTDSTRSKYFNLLRRLKKESGGAKMQISATIRLHQIKYYQRTGIPPVDRGMLMFYNMADLTDFDTANSILDLDVARRYTSNLRRYPLKLDVALPLYSWGVVFQDRRFIGLARDYRYSDMKRPSFRHCRDRLFQVETNAYLHDTQLYKGDLIRIEESTYGECRQSAKLLKRDLKLNSQSRVLFFHYNQADLGAMGLEKVDQIFRTFN